jgi:hypothetical protein
LSRFPGFGGLDLDRDAGRGLFFKTWIPLRFIQATSFLFFSREVGKVLIFWKSILIFFAALRDTKNIESWQRGVLTVSGFRRA